MPHQQGFRRGGRVLAGEAWAPGTCGELVQGTIDGLPFLVTCPIAVYARVRVWLVPGGAGLVSIPASPKVEEAVRRTAAFILRDVSPPLGGFIAVDSPLPRGKGMASSSAEIAAACLAVARALGASLNAGEIARLALSIEPSDGVMFRGIVQLDHVGGRLCRWIGDPLPLDVLVLDLGGEVDTVAFNTRPDLPRLNRAKEPLVREALRLVEEGFKRHDPALIGKGATLSALAHQQVLPKHLLPEALDLASHLGAVGMNIAHSGTVVGLLFDARDAWNPSSRRALWATLRLADEAGLPGGMRPLFLSRLVNGGVK